MKTWIYGLYFDSETNIFYVGKTRNKNKRFYSHKRKTFAKGKQLKITTLEVFDDQEIPWSKKEAEWIQKFPVAQLLNRTRKSRHETKVAYSRLSVMSEVTNNPLQLVADMSLCFTCGKPKVSCPHRPKRTRVSKNQAREELLLSV